MKSVTVVAERQPHLRVACGAFNNHIAAELTSRLPPSIPATTLHGLGFAAIRRRFPDVRLEENKLRLLLDQLTAGNKDLEWPSVRRPTEQLAKLCKYTLTPERSALQILDLANHYGVEIDDRDTEKVCNLVSQLVAASADQMETIDFDDMVWLPTRHGLKPDQYDVFLGDEAQDWNRAQQALAKAATASGRLVPIGDAHQAIYGFAGADCDALPRLTKELSATPLPLTVTWRCPALHVELARKIVSSLEAAPGAVDGLVMTADLAEIAQQVRPGDLVICRKNTPVVGLTYRLVLAGVPAVMRGREIGQGLIAFMRRLKPASIGVLVDLIEDFRWKEEGRLRRKRAPESQYDALNDRCDCLGQLATQVTSLDQLEAFITEKFDDKAQPGEQVVLSSVHRAKGLEADNVFVLDPGSLPLIRRDSKPWQRIQEYNLIYIAITRAKRVLTFEDFIPKALSGERS